MAEWAEILGVKKSLIKNRRWRGWSIERIIEQEVENHEKTILTTMPTLTSQNEWVSVKDNIVPTKAPNEPHNNADRIRSMSDEELAREFGRTCPKRNTRACDKRCSRCWLEWLQKPAEGGT